MRDAARVSTKDSTALAELLRSVPLFSLVDAAHLPELTRLLRPAELSVGEVLFHEGDAGVALWVLEDGTEVAVRARKSGADESVTVARLGPGEVVGEMALVDGGARSGTALVTHAGPAQRLDAMDFQALREAGHPAAFQVLRHLCLDLCRRIRATSNRIASPATTSPQGARALPGVRPEPEALERFPPFRLLPQVVKLALAQRLVWMEAEGEVPIVTEGEEGDAAYLVVEGAVAVSRGGHTLELMRAGQMFGLVALLDRGPRAATCTTAGPARLLRLSAQDFDALYSRGNRFAFHIVDHVARQLVAHLRQANRLLDTPAAARSTPPARNTTVPESRGARLLEGPPLELELALDEERMEALSEWVG